DDGEGRGRDDQEEGQVGVHLPASPGRRSERFQDPAIPHQDHALRLVADGRVVRDDDEGEALLAVKALHQVDDLLGRLGVEVPGRLVGEDDVRLVHEGAGDRDPLLLAAAEFRGLLQRHVFQSDRGDRPEGPMIATISPFRMSRSSPRSAWTSTPPLSYVLTSRRAITIRSSLRGAGAGLAGAATGAWTVIASVTTRAGSEGVALRGSRSK